MSQSAVISMDTQSTCVLIVRDKNRAATFHGLEIHLSPYVCLNVDLGVIIVN